MANLMSQVTLPIAALAAVADAFSGTVYSSAWKMSLYQRALAYLHKAVGTTGTSTVTVQACSDTSHTGATAIPFKYRKDNGALTQATTAGFTTTAGSNQMYQIEIDAKDIPADLPYVEIKCVEVVDSPVLGCIIVVLHEPKFAGASMPSA